MTPEYLPVCSPTLATQAQPLGVPADLRHQVLLQDDTITDPTSGSAWGWPQWLAAAGVATLAATGGRRFSNTVLALEAALAGQGVALASRPLVAAHLANGTLVAPFTTSVRSPFSYDLVGERHEAGRAEVHCLRRWLVDEAAAESRATPGAADPLVQR